MTAKPLREIQSFADLLVYLEENLDWPLQGYSLEDASFTYEPTELGLKEDDAAAIKAIHQLRPVTSGQPWGIFFVEFENKKLPVVLLRRILSHLSVKKRASANKATAPAWHAEDLLFITAFGVEDTDAREIAFAHFHQNPGDMPTLHVLGWDGGDTPLKLAQLDHVLHERLHWPEDENNAKAWRETWSKPFRHRIGHVIQTADLLAEELAKLARGIRDKAKRLLDAESASGPLTKLFKAFQIALIHDLTPATFADTYAQTITYGLLTAAISRTEMSEGRHGTALIAENVVDMVPVTNPFLKEMLQTFLKVGGRKGGIDFDELGIQDVVELLRGDETDLPAILRDFGNKTRGEDPVIHFYEHFLSAYNKQLKIQRGVFYTPQPVVSYIVRSVHELLQTEFGLVDGLADTTTWGEMVKKHPGLKLPPLTDEPNEARTISPDEPFVQILDPATGTATFLVEAIDVIHRTLAAKWKQQHFTDAQQLAAWNDYVPKHLLPRLHAYELMMAPYAIAHMKIGLKLAETGYRFGTEERARIYLTNALEPWQRQMKLPDFEALAHEAIAVNEIKREKRFTVIIGNPPYSNYGQLNKIPFILKLLEDYKKGLGERKLNLDDDFIKFLRFSQWIIDNTQCGILALITNNTYLDGIAHRLMRRSLLDSFPKIWITDLHGSALRNETSIQGVSDENVFDIQQGVAIGAFVKPIITSHPSEISFAECWGTRDAKYVRLARTTAKTDVSIALSPKAESFYLFPHATEGSDEYNLYWSIADIFPVFSSGIDTKIDRLLIDTDSEALATRLVDILNPSISISEVKRKYEIPLTSTWEIDRAKTARFRKECVTPITYRFFDSHYTYFDEKVLSRARQNVMQHLHLGENIGLISARQLSQRGQGWALVGVSNKIIERCAISSNTREGNYLFPLWLYSDGQDLVHTHRRRPNFKPQFLQALSKALGIAQTDTHGLPDAFTPEDIFHYAYAVFHSPDYRSRYVEFLKIDFPRLPLTGNLELFRALASLGGELVALHLLESPKVNAFITRFEGKGDNSIPKKPTWKDGAVWINASQRFEGVPEAVWHFHVGGYQVCEKWLKDRKGRTLTADDITHYQRVVVALNETIRLMAEIDRVIETHGGWPGAFQSSADEVAE